MRVRLMLALMISLASCSSQGTGEEQIEKEKPDSPVTVQTGVGVKSSVTGMLTSYLQLKDALINYDTLNANKAADELAKISDSVDYNGTTDSAVIRTIADYTGTIHSEALGLTMEKDLTEKRRAFSMITENLYPLLRAIQFNEGKLYYQMCPMAFNDNESAYWISNSREINNPYLGTKHPKYASGMLHCGELKDSISYAK